MKGDCMKLYFFLAVTLLGSVCSLYPDNNEPKRLKVGLLVMATGRYTVFLEPLFKSAEKYFLPNHDVTYFVFTDGDVPNLPNVVKIFQKRIGWPYDTLMRFSVYLSSRSLLSSMDYLYSCDADMLFVDSVGDEILSERVATEHPGFVPKTASGKRPRGSYETNSLSTAYVGPDEGNYYFAGGFYGGSIKEMLTLFQRLTNNIEKDLEKNHIAVWHDESHLNRYFIDYTPTTILSPSYCYPESWKLPYAKKLLALDKQHSEFQTK